MKKLWIFIVVISLLTACDCIYELKGVAVDSQTRLPITDVTVSKHWIKTPNLDDVTTTDTEGYFLLDGIAGRCGQFELRFEKEGYQTRLATLSHTEYDTVMLTSNLKNTKTSTQ